MDRALVTGGAGSIGSRMAHRLLELGYHVTVIDDLSSGYRENVPADAELIEADFTNDEILGHVFAGEPFNYVFHFAALFANQNSVEHPERDLVVNGLGTLRLAERARRTMARGRLHRVLYVSSSCIYGNATGPLPEDLAPRPETPYAITKLLGENYLRFFSQQYGIPVTIVRLFNCYGPGERPGKYRNVIPNFVQSALRDEPLTITGTGRETRDFTYIDDIVDGILLAATSEKSIGQTYNLATGRETTIRQLIETIVRLCGSSSEVRYGERRSWDHTARRCGNIEKARKDLGYKPATRIEEGLIPTIDWIRSLDATTRSNNLRP